MKKLIIIGGAGFIGTNACYFFVKKKYKILVLDKLTYAGKLKNINPLIKNKLIKFKKLDISNYIKLENEIFNFFPDIIINFAAESHVDRSISSPKVFINSNVLGVYNILFAIKNYQEKKKNNIHFFQISTDEVYGSLSKGFANEYSFINPSSPYSSSKSAADSLILGMSKTYNINFNITRCTNNYGPYQFPEKLIPITLHRALNNKQIKIYGNGKNKRDWIYVLDHINAIYSIIKKGKINNIYNIGAQNIYSNNYIVKKILIILKKYNKNSYFKNLNSNITYVNDRLAHDFRYAVNTSKIYKDTKWIPKSSFDKTLENTINWYLNEYKWGLNENKK